jgi:hypothetical protein
LRDGQGGSGKDGEDPDGIADKGSDTGEEEGALTLEDRGVESIEADEEEAWQHPGKEVNHLFTGKEEANPFCDADEEDQQKREEGCELKEEGACFSLPFEAEFLVVGDEDRLEGPFSEETAKKMGKAKGDHKGGN